VLATRHIFGAVLVVCSLALGACGSSSNDTGQTAPPPPGNGADRAFVNAILPLHDKAVAVAVIGGKRGNKFVKDISAQVAGSQPQETARLRAIGSALFAAGVPVGTLGVAPTNATDVDLKALNTVKPFEKAFLKAMIPIHQATIALAKAEIAKGDQVDLKTTSQAIIDAEAAQLKAMQQHLRSAR